MHWACEWTSLPPHTEMLGDPKMTKFWGDKTWIR